MKLVNSSQQTELWLVRHGQTDWNIERRFQGHTDIPLNTQGIEQARKLAAFLNGSRIPAVYSSDLTRALKTAEILAEGRNIPVFQDPRLREINMGSWEGRTWPDVNEHLTGEMEQLNADPVFGRAPGGESLAEVAERLKAAADEITARHPGQTVLIVSHGLSVGALNCLANGIPLALAREKIPENCTILPVKWRLAGE